MAFQVDNFRVVPEDYLEAVVSFANARALAGYKVVVEPEAIHLPTTPALLLVQDATSIYVEPGGARLPESRIDDWIRYAQSCPDDTRIIYCCNRHLSPEKEAWLRGRKVGLTVCDRDQVVDCIPPHDLAMRLALPPLENLRAALRRKLSRVYEKDRNGDWRSAFEEACKAFEVVSRAYLIKHCRSGRITLLNPSGRTRVPTNAQINKMPIGALAECFDQILRKNVLDSRIGQTLVAINKDRIAVAHKKPRAEKRIRQNVGKNMWAIIGCMKEM